MFWHPSKKIESNGVRRGLASVSPQIPHWHVVEAVVGLVGVGVLFLGSDVVSVRPALTERPDPVVLRVVGALHRQSRAFCRSDLDVGEGLEQVSVRQVDVANGPMPGKRAGTSDIVESPFGFQVIDGLPGIFEGSHNPM